MIAAAAEPEVRWKYDSASLGDKGKILRPMRQWSEGFDEATQRAVLMAQDEAARRGHGAVEPSHILFAILGSRPKLVVGALQNIGVNLPRLRAVCTRLLAGLKLLPSGVREVPFSANSESVLENSREEANRMRNALVGEEHLFLALIKEFGRFRNNPFRRAGVDLERMRKSLREVISDASVFGLSQDAACAVALAKQLGIPFASFENKILKMENGQELDVVVSEEFARKYLVIPLFRDEGVLAVALENPEDHTLINELKRLSGLEIQPFIATRKQIIIAIDKSYKHG